MKPYQPLRIAGNKTGLVQEREEFLLPDDAYPKLVNAYVWREGILRKTGLEFLGRLERSLEDQSLGDTIATGVSFNFWTQINLSGAINGITNANPGEVNTTTPHLLQDGQFVTLSGVGGMTQVNTVTFQITVTGANTFTIGVDTSAFGVYTVGGTWETNNLSQEIYKNLKLGSVVITMPGPIVFTDQGDGTLTSPTIGNSGVINYQTGDITLTTTAGAGTSTVDFSYYPTMPVMGINLRELQNSANDQTIFFDQKYAYRFNQPSNSFQEFIPGTVWNKRNADYKSTDFFWSTNYWVSSTPIFTTTNRKLFWVTNNTGFYGAQADPPRITDGVTWVDWYTKPGGVFTPKPWTQINATEYLVNWLSMLPFRGRMLVFNTWEGINDASAQNYSNRIRWSTIGNPFISYTAGPPSAGSWRDDIRGQGGFLDIPTSEDIISVGFVRDNLVVYCERSTWQLRYTGRSIAPFQIERVNSELGAQGPFSSIQFDTSLLGIGDKGIVNCDSYKSERIDIKIPDFVFRIVSIQDSGFRVHGVRDFIRRLAYWTIPLSSAYDPRVSRSERVFPNIRLVYNYENDSWATFTDTLTTLGTYQPQSGRTWLNTKLPWVKCNFSWLSSQPQGIPSIVGGTQHGYIEYVTKDIERGSTANDPTLHISNITPNTNNPTVIECFNHNLVSESVIEISGIPEGSPYDNLNGGIFGIYVLDEDTFELYTYDPNSREFSTPQTDAPDGDYIGGGEIRLRDNFSIVSKKFNFVDQGKSIQLGFIDILLEATSRSNPGAITLKMYNDYNMNEASNTLPQNEVYDYSPLSNPDPFFNSVVPTYPSALSSRVGDKFWHRVICPTTANFLTLEYTFSNAQLAGEEYSKNVQIDCQILWIRPSGKITQI